MVTTSDDPLVKALRKAIAARKSVASEVLGSRERALIDAEEVSLEASEGQPIDELERLQPGVINPMQDIELSRR